MIVIKRVIKFTEYSLYKGLRGIPNFASQIARHCSLSAEG